MGARVVKVGRHRATQVIHGMGYNLINVRCQELDPFKLCLRSFLSKTKFRLENSCLMLRADIWGNVGPLLVLGYMRMIKNAIPF